MQIQSAAPNDLDEIQNLLSSLGLPHSDLTPSHLEHFFVCRDGDEIAGIVGLELYGNAALLRSLAVRSKYRSKGIGARLTEKVEQYACRQGAKEVYLLTTTAADYFDRRDYDIISRDQLPKSVQETEEAASLCPSSATCMRKDVAALMEGTAR